MENPIKTEEDYLGIPRFQETWVNYNDLTVPLNPGIMVNKIYEESSQNDLIYFSFF
jgi:hypothetical protein